jgi:hypothetical protein
MKNGDTTVIGRVREQLRVVGFAWVPAADLRALLPTTALAHWQDFADSWNDLGVDTYMADAGRYRRRRFGAFTVSATQIVRKSHQPHYQSRDYNPLNGGIERWFLPLTDACAGGAVLPAILRLSHEVFDALTPAESRPAAWHGECHQFRIEARPGEPGLPTPEGLHRDGVDWVLVLLVARVNIVEGMTSIHDAQRRLLGSFTLENPLDAAFVDDARVYHGVTAVGPLDAARAAWRDVLVVTFRRN